MKELLAELADILEVEELKPDTNFTDLPECDSLSLLSIIVAMDSRYGARLTASEIKQAGTGRLLHELVERRKK
jgi:acyl carrier protein